MRFKDMDLEAAFGSAFEAAGGEAFGDAWAREEAKIESAFGSAFEAADDIADLRLQGAWGDDVYAAPEARMAASMESLTRAAEGLVGGWPTHGNTVLVYVLAYLLEAEMGMVRKCTIRAADEASNTQWAARGEALRTALESCDRSVVLEHIFTRAVGETGPSDADGLLGEYTLYTNVSLKEAVGTVGRPAPETAHAELKAIREICKVAYRAAALEVAYRARRNTCMAAPETAHEDVIEAVEVLKSEFSSSHGST